MLTSPDFKELLKLFEKHEIRAKEASARPQNRIDVDKLKEVEQLDGL
jgi:hypothetical protein